MTNPFDNLILLSPRRREAALECGLNHELLDALSDEFSELEQQKTKGIAESKGARLVLSPQHGYGKSHLLGRLFQRLSERAVCIYLTPYADPSGGWRAVLNAVVDELCQAQNFMTASAQGEQIVPQMEFFAANVLLTLVEQRRQHKRLPPELANAHLALTTQMAQTGQISGWLEWLDSSGMIKDLGGELRRAGLDLQPSSQAWMQIFFQYVRAERNDTIRHDAIDWLRGRPLDDDQRERLSLRPQDGPEPDASRPALNALARERLSMLCRLAKFHLPLLICFDQIESFCHEPALTRSFGNVVCELSNAQDAAGPCFPNQAVVVTANQLEWEGVIKPALYPAELQRFRPQQALYLLAPTRPQAISLASLRLDHAGYGPHIQKQFIEGPWFNACFQGERVAFGVRDFLLRCQQQWPIFESHLAQQQKNQNQNQNQEPQTPAPPPPPQTISSNAPPSNDPNPDADLEAEPEEAWDILIEDLPALSPPKDNANETQTTIYKMLDDAERALKRQDGALHFNPDALTWIVSHFGRTIPGVRVALQDDKSNFIHTVWHIEGGEGAAWIGFITDDSNHWRRWRSIREDAQRRCTAHPGAKVIALRTLDLNNIPGPNWANEGEPFRLAQRSVLDVIVIDRAWLARLFGARQVVMEIEQGKYDIPGGASAVLAILTPLLDPLWARLRASLPVESRGLPALPPLTAGASAQARPPQAAPSHPQQKPIQQPLPLSVSPSTPAASTASPSTTALTVTELLRSIRFTLEAPRHRQSPSEAAEAGAVFHACARALHDLLTKHPDAPPPHSAADIVWSFFSKHLEPCPWRHLSHVRAADVQVAARTFCDHISHLGQNLSAQSRWSDLLLGAEIERARYYQPRDSAHRVRLSGRVDAWRRVSGGWSEVVDYKLRVEPKSDDLYQVAAYAWLMGATPEDADAPRIGARIEYVSDKVTTLALNPDEVLALIRAEVEPTLRKWLRRDPEPVMVLPPLSVSETQAPERVVKVLADYGLEVELVGDPIEAPQVQRLRLRPLGKTTVKQIEQRSSDLKVKLSLREIPLIEPGQGSVYVDIPRPQPHVVPWDILQHAWHEGHPTASALALPIAVGVDNQPITLDLGDPSQCHVLVAGTSGSGKSELLRSVLASLAARNSPETLRLTLIDPKRVTFSPFARSPFLEQGEVLFELESVIECLEALGNEMQRIYEGLSLGNPMPIARVVVIDEFADLIRDRVFSKRFEGCIQKLAALGRAANFHLILATQYPTHQVINTAIKVNLPVRVCLKMPSSKNSQMVIDQGGAEHLLGRGDLICVGVSGSACRGQAPLVESMRLRDLLRVSD